MTVVGEAWVRIRADGKAFPAETRAATQGGMAEMEAQSAIGGRRAGGRAGKEFATGSETALKGERGRFVSAGENIGGGMASGIGGGAKKGEQAVAGSAERMGRDMEKTGGHASRLGILSQLGFGRVASAAAMGTAGVAVGAAVAVGASIKMASTFQESTTQLVTGAGESGKAIGSVRDGLLTMAGQVGVSANDLAKGMYMVESAGFHGAAGLHVMKIAAEGAKVGGADMATVTDAVTTSLNAYKLPASSAASVTNDLIATVAHGKTHLQDLSSSLGAVLPIAAALHVKLPEVTGAMATMTMQGTSASKASTSLRFLMNALVNPSIKASGALQDVGLTAGQLGDTLTHKGLHAALNLVTDAVGKKFPVGSAKYTAAIADIVGGTRGMTAALELSGTHSKDWTKNTQAIGNAAKDTSGKVHGWALVQGDFGTQMSRVGASLGAFAIKIGTVLLPPLTAAAKWFATFVSWLGEKVGPALKKAGDFLGGIGRVIAGIFGGGGDKQTSGVAKGFDAVTKAANGVSGGFKKLGPVASGLKALFTGVWNTLKGLGQLIVGYYKGLISAYVTLWQGFTRIVKRVVDTVKQYLADHKEAVRKTFVAIGAVLRGIGATFKAVFDFIKVVIRVAVGIITDLWDRFGKHLVGHIHTELNLVIQFFKGVFSILRGIFDVFAGIFTGKWGRVWRGLKEIASGIWNIISALFKHFVNYLSLILGAAVAVITSIWGRLWRGVRALFILIWHGIYAAGKAILGAIVSYITGRLRDFVGFWTGLWNTVRRVFTVIWNGIRTAAKAVWNAISSFFRAALHDFGAWWGNVWNGIKRVFTVIWNAIRAVGKAIWNSLGDALRGAIRGFVAFWIDRWNAVKHVFAVIWDGIRTVARTIWAAISGFFRGAVRAFVGWWTDRWGDVKRVFSQAWTDIKTAARNAWNAISSFFSGALRTFVGWWKGRWGDVKQGFLDIWKDIGTGVKNAWGAVERAVATGVNGIIGLINNFIDVINLIPLVKIPHIGRVHWGGGAQGGVLPGYAPGVDSVPYMLSPGEGVLVPEAVRALGPSWVRDVNQRYAAGRTAGPHVGGVGHAAAGHAPGLPDNPQGGHDSRAQEKKKLATAMARPNVTAGSLMQLFLGPAEAVAHLIIDAAIGKTFGKLPAKMVKGVADEAIKAFMGLGKTGINEMMAGGGTNPKRSAVIDYAKKFIGTPYVWGGAEPGGFDCSGFTSFVLNHFKIGAPRTAAQQQDWTTGIPKSRALQADLTFFGNPAHHVGFWLGNDKYLDAPHTGASIGVQPIYDSPNFGSVPGLGAAFTAGAGGVSNTANQALGRRLVAAQGLDWNAVNYVFSHESGWDNTAQNPGSTAYGIAQFLDGTWPQYGPKTSDPWHQIEYGLKYMNDRYGGPDGAAAYWRVHHNYDTGGWLQPGLTKAVNGTGAREAVMPEDVMVAAIERSQNPAALLKAVDELTDYAAAIRDAVVGMGPTGPYRGVTSA